MKKMLLLALSASFILASATAFAGKFDNCTVTEVNGDQVTMVCPNLEKKNKEAVDKQEDPIIAPEYKVKGNARPPERGC